MKHANYLTLLLSVGILAACGQQAAVPASQTSSDLRIEAEPARPDGMIRLAANVSPRQGIRSLTIGLREAGLTVFARVDHAANASRAGLTMPDSQLIVFGNPNVGTPLMIERPEFALELPMKLLAYVDANGDTWVAYQDPIVLAEQYGLPREHPSIEKMTEAMARFAQIAAGLNVEQSSSLPSSET